MCSRFRLLRETATIRLLHARVRDERDNVADIITPSESGRKLSRVTTLCRCWWCSELSLCWPIGVLQGEKLEDDIIEIATVLREKADEMVEKTGAINFEVIQPMIDEIAVLKSKYK